MKKSNKISVFYFLSSISLLVILIFGGVYGVYISVGLNFVRGTVSNVTEAGKASNVAFGGSVNFQSSMTGVVILSIILIILAVFDIVSLVKQVIFFKQFKVVRESSLEQSIEKKVKSKGSVIFFAVLIDVLSIIAGVAGVFINARTFVGNNISWVLYLVDGAVAVLALFSLIFLIIKLKKLKKNKTEDIENINQISGQKKLITRPVNKVVADKDEETMDNFDIDEIEYSLLKLKHLKSTKIISSDEFEFLRSKILNYDKEEITLSEIKKDKK